jgi:hypothetical protein
VKLLVEFIFTEPENDVAGKVEGRTYGVANIEFVTEPEGNDNEPKTDNPLFADNKPLQDIAGRVEGRLYGVCNIVFVILPGGRIRVPD